MNYYLESTDSNKELIILALVICFYILGLVYKIRVHSYPISPRDRINHRPVKKPHS